MENKESRNGKIAETNTRFSLTINKKFKAKIQKLAEEDEKSLNNFIISAIEEYIRNRE